MPSTLPILDLDFQVVFPEPSVDLLSDATFQRRLGTVAELLAIEQGNRGQLLEGRANYQTVCSTIGEVIAVTLERQFLHELGLIVKYDVLSFESGSLKIKGKLTFKGIYRLTKKVAVPIILILKLIHGGVTLYNDWPHMIDMYRDVSLVCDETAQSASLALGTIVHRITPIGDRDPDIKKGD